ncbi:MAG TPA: GNAT family N-acetyltransferase [Trebonia sp.]|nr:GNAT family N-acetyltransferase [Trebonia sp.]
MPFRATRPSSPGCRRRHYRGALSDAFLDGGVDEFLRAKWTSRLASPDPAARTIVAESDGVVAGFAHVLLGEDPTWGCLLDNLHVSYELKRSGIGTRLMAEVAQAVLDWSPSSGLYLWVLEQNLGAQAFYTARGGTCVERAADEPPNGDPAVLSGTVMVLRFAWPDPSRLLEPSP